MGIWDFWGRGEGAITGLPLYSMLGLFSAFLPCCITPTHAAVEPVTVNVPNPKADVGQRLPFFVELRAKGSFGGATSFTLPEAPGTVIVEVGNPVVSSEQLEGKDWFVQSHEFALFSQKDGTIQIPAFPVHYGIRDGFTGPVTEQNASVPGFSVEIQRPAGSDPDRFLVTTDSLTVNEQWDPQPGGEVKTGAVFKRTIIQSAGDMTGMGLAPAPTTAPDGIKVYRGTPEVTDNTERGALSGTRTETLTYLVQEPGVYTLPAIRYDWWNPTTKVLESKTLPLVSFTATAPPISETLGSASRSRSALLLTIGVLIAGAALVLGWSYRRGIALSLRRLYDRVDPPELRAARAFLRACDRNDAHAAMHSWAVWRKWHPGCVHDAELQSEIVNLHRHFFGATPGATGWKGAALAKAFRSQTRAIHTMPNTDSLPPLNP